MKTIDNDNQFREAVRKIKLDSPSAGFSSRVMDAVLAESVNKEVFKQEPILGTRFWVIIAMFVLLTAFFFLLSGGTDTAGAESTGIFNRLNTPDFSGVKNSWSILLEKMGGIPLTVAGILLATSSLLLIDKYFNSRHKLSF